MRTIRSKLDDNEYPKVVKVTDGQIAGLSLKPDKFHGEWNYMLSPTPKTLK